MDHVGGGDQEAHLGAHRNHQRLVDFQQVVFVLGRLVVDLVGGRGQVAEELDVLAQVLVVPFPLVAGDLHIQPGFGGVVDVDQRLGRRHRHQHEDDEGHDGPEDFHGGALVEMRGLLPGGAAMDDHRPEHGTEDQYADDDADPEDGHVQIEYGAADLGCPGRHVDCPGSLRLAENRPQQESHPDSWMSHHCGFPFSFLLSRRLGQRLGNGCPDYQTRTADLGTQVHSRVPSGNAFRVGV
ncbi:hypothetical protein D3C85_1053540 [compost metagenome]